MKKILYFLISTGFLLSISTDVCAKQAKNDTNMLKNIFIHNDPAQITLEFTQPINFEKKFAQEKNQLKIYLHDTKILKTFHPKILSELAKLNFVKQVDIKQKTKNHMISVLYVTLAKDQTSNIVTNFHIECIKQENAQTLVINISKQKPPHLIDSAVIFTAQNSALPTQTIFTSNFTNQETKKKMLEL